MFTQLTDPENIRTMLLLVSALISLLSALIAFSAYRLNKTNLQTERAFKAPYLTIEMQNLSVREDRRGGQFSTIFEFSLRIENSGERPADGIVYEYYAASKSTQFQKKEQLANNLPKGKSIVINRVEIVDTRIAVDPQDFTIFLDISYIDKLFPGEILKNLFAYKWGGGLGSPSVQQANAAEAMAIIQKMHPVDWAEFSKMVDNLLPFKRIRQFFAKK